MVALLSPFNGLQVRFHPLPGVSPSAAGSISGPRLNHAHHLQDVVNDEKEEGKESPDKILRSSFNRFTCHLVLALKIPRIIPGEQYKYAPGRESELVMLWVAPGGQYKFQAGT